MNTQHDSHYSSSMINTLPQATTLQELLKLLRRHPGLMGSRVSVSHLSAFLEGFLYCQQESRYTEDWEHISSFSRWIHAKFKSETTLGWPILIESRTDSEQAALVLFWSLYDEFLATRSA